MTPMKTAVQRIASELFEDPGLNAFAILDGASVPGLLQHMHRCDPVRECLYRGELQPDIAEVAPYLVQLEAGTEFTDLVLNQGWGKHWGIFAVTAADLFTMRQHLRRFLTVHDSAGKPLLFRYYDPRVMSIYLPTCNAEEVKAIFGPISKYLMESETPDIALSFQSKNGSLVQKKVALTEVDGRK
ncbi:MAG: DUF4123 domain-containing protein [Bryobacteraceae bacterium]